MNEWINVLDELPPEGVEVEALNLIPERPEQNYIDQYSDSPSVCARNGFRYIYKSGMAGNHITVWRYKPGTTPSAQGPQPAFSRLSRECKDLIKAAPENPMVRGLVLRDLNLWLPEALVTAEEIETWINAQPVPELPKPAKSFPGIGVPVTRREQVTGTCRFSGTQSGQGTVTLTDEDILSCAEEADCYDSFRDYISNVINEDIGNQVELEVEEPAVDGMELSRFEVTDGQEAEDTFSLNDAASNAWDRLKEIAPDKYDELGGNYE